MVVDTFIRRPILASVCSLVIILAGAIAIPTLPIAQFPELAPPQVLGDRVLQRRRTPRRSRPRSPTPIEQAINGVEGMQYMTSTSGNDGTSAITVTFDITRNLDVAAVDVQNRISQAEGRLPNEVKQVGISVTKVSNNFVLAAAAFAEHGEYDRCSSATTSIASSCDEIKRVPGVGDVIVFGDRPLRDAAVAGSRQARRPQHHRRRSRRGAARAERAGGGRRRSGRRRRGRARRFRSACARSGRLSEPAEFDNIILKRSPDGALVRVKDVGRTELGAESYTTASRYNGARRPSASACCSCRPPTRCRSTATSARRSSGCRERFPPGLKVEVAFDTTTRRRPNRSARS